MCLLVKFDVMEILNYTFILLKLLKCNQTPKGMLDIFLRYNSFIFNKQNIEEVLFNLVLN